MKKQYWFCYIILIFGILNILNVRASDFQNIYNEAWSIAGQNFYDSTMNHQNWSYWKKHYSNKIASQDDLEIAINSMLVSLDDQYTRYLTADYFKNEQSEVHDYADTLFTKPRYYNTHIPQNIKYIRIDSMMNKNLAPEIEKFIEESEKNNKLKGYIIDLRDNGGGLVKNASDIASLFMNNKIVLYAKTNNKQLKNTTKNDGCITQKPVVILVNNNTASACEVFTGTMQDNKRAYIIGSQSFGKGIIQKIIPLSDKSGLHITVMSYYTPSMKEINHNGITPDKTVYFTRKDIFLHQDVQLKAAIKYLNTISK